MKSRRSKRRVEKENRRVHWGILTMLMLTLICAVQTNGFEKHTNAEISLVTSISQIALVEYISADVSEK